MKAAVEKDVTVREITIKLVDAPFLDVTRSWHLKPRSIGPSQAAIRIVDGVTRSIVVSGGLVLKSGRVGTQQLGRAEWRDKSYSSQGSADPEFIPNAPLWVRLLWAEAPLNVTEWTLAPEEALGPEAP